MVIVINQIRKCSNERRGKLVERYVVAKATVSLIETRGVPRVSIVSSYREKEYVHCMNGGPSK